MKAEKRGLRKQMIVEQKKKPKVPMVILKLTIDEALDAAIALALAEYIDKERFEEARQISYKVCRQIEKIMEAEKHG